MSAGITTSIGNYKV